MVDGCNNIPDTKILAVIERKRIKHLSSWLQGCKSQGSILINLLVVETFITKTAELDLLFNEHISFFKKGL